MKPHMLINQAARMSTGSVKGAPLLISTVALARGKGDPQEFGNRLNGFPGRFSLNGHRVKAAVLTRQKRKLHQSARRIQDPDVNTFLFRASVGATKLSRMRTPLHVNASRQRGIYESQKITNYAKSR